MIEVVVADDDEGFRRLVAARLDAEVDMVVTGEATDGDQAVTRATELVADVVLLDVAMPGTGGIEAAAAIKHWLPVTQVIMLTASDDEEDLYKALRAGASGYLLKDDALVEVCALVRAAASGHVVLSPSMAAKLVTDLARPLPAPAPCLSKREVDILRLVAKGQNNTAIADRLFVSSNTVKRHMANILAKLHLRTRLEAVLYAQHRDMLD